MSEIIKIEDFSDPRLDIFVRLTGAQLRSKLEPEKGVFIAEPVAVCHAAPVTLGPQAGSTAIPTQKSRCLCWSAS